MAQGRVHQTLISCPGCLPLQANLHFADWSPLTRFQGEADMLEDLHSSPIPSVTSQKCSGSIASIQAVFVSVLVQVFLWQGLAR